MSKEMTATEIAELTSEVEVANKRVLFNYLTKDIENWKMPFGATIPSDTYDKYNDAAIWFAGCKLQITRIFKKDGKQYYDVFGEGYYNAIGA